MYFQLFERLLNQSYATIKGKYGKTHEVLKIRNLLRKIQDKDLEHDVLMVEQKCDSNPDTYTYQNAMNDLKRVVLRCKQDTGGYNSNKFRRIKESNACKKQHNKQFAQKQKKWKNYHNDARRITLKNSKQVYFNHSFNFDTDTFQNLTEQQKQQLFQERQINLAMIDYCNTY